MENIQDLCCGKMSPEHSQATKGKTLKQSSKKQSASKEKFLFLDLRKISGKMQDASWEMDTRLLGESWMPNIAESPKDEEESFLSQILEANVPEKYYLSATACQGILRRAETRGKELPPILKTALEQQIERCYSIENHPNDSRVKIDESGVVQSLTSRMGTGGGNVPLVMEQQSYALRERAGCKGGGKGPLVQTEKTGTLNCSNDQTIFCLQGNMIGRKEENGPQGNGVNEDVSFTLNTTDKHAVAYNICSYASNAMMSENPNSGIYETEKTRTLDLQGGNPSCNQGGTMIVEAVAFEPGIAKRDGSENRFCENISPTIRANMGDNDPSVVYALDRAMYNQGVNAQYEPQISENGICHTLVAKGPNAVCAPPHYIVRRLTPLECCRLQGFPDYWCSDLATPNPTEEDVAFWKDVFETHSQIVNGKPSKKTDKQIIKWLQDPYSDSSEYKMWGNGIALPCMARFLNRIPLQVQVEQQEIEDLLD